jgi:prophage maintenance system killer protein
MKVWVTDEKKQIKKENNEKMFLIYAAWRTNILMDFYFLSGNKKAQWKT